MKGVTNLPKLQCSVVANKLNIAVYNAKKRIGDGILEVVKPNTKKMHYNLNFR